MRMFESKPWSSAIAAITLKDLTTLQHLKISVLRVTQVFPEGMLRLQNVKPMVSYSSTCKTIKLLQAYLLDLETPALVACWQENTSFCCLDPLEHFQGMNKSPRKFVPKKPAKPKSGRGSQLALVMESYSCYCPHNHPDSPPTHTAFVKEIRERERNRSGRWLRE